MAGFASGNASVNYGVAKDVSLLLLSSTLRGPSVVDEAVELYQQAFEKHPEVKIYSNSWGFCQLTKNLPNLP